MELIQGLSICGRRLRSCDQQGLDARGRSVMLPAMTAVRCRSARRTRTGGPKHRPRELGACAAAPPGCPGQQIERSTFQPRNRPEDREPGGQECIGARADRPVGQPPPEGGHHAKQRAEHERERQIEQRNGAHGTIGHDRGVDDADRRVLHRLGDLRLLEAGLDQRVQLLLHRDLSLQSGRLDFLLRQRVERPAETPSHLLERSHLVGQALQVRFRDALELRIELPDPGGEHQHVGILGLSPNQQRRPLVLDLGQRSQQLGRSLILEQGRE